MKPSKFLEKVSETADQFAGRAFAAEIWIGRLTRERLAQSDTVTRSEIVSDLELLLTKHKAHPTFAKHISQALQQLAE